MDIGVQVSGCSHPLAWWAILVDMETLSQTFCLQQMSRGAGTSQCCLSYWGHQNCVQNKTLFSSVFTSGLLHSSRQLKQRFKQGLKTLHQAKSIILQGTQRAYISQLGRQWSMVDRTRTLEEDSLGILCFFIPFLVKRFLYIREREWAGGRGRESLKRASHWAPSDAGLDLETLRSQPELEPSQTLNQLCYLGTQPQLLH